MYKLIVDQMGLEKFHQIAEVMEFYPFGLKGLITDYLVHYLACPTSGIEENSRDLDFFGRVLEYQRTHPNYLQMGIEDANALVLVVKVSDIAREIIQQYGEMLHNGIFDPDRIDWQEGYLLVPTRN